MDITFDTIKRKKKSQEELLRSSKFITSDKNRRKCDKERISRTPEEFNKKLNSEQNDEECDATKVEQN